MKRIILSIVILLLIICCVPQSIETVRVGSCGSMTQQEDDSREVIQKTEHIAINYARKEKKLVLEKHYENAEKITIHNAVTYYDIEFNDLGLLTEAIKRDYSGEAPVNI